MNEILRFVARRSAQQDLPVFTLQLAFESTPLFVALLTARASENARSAMIETARAFETSAGFAGSPAQLALFTSLTQFYDALDGQEQFGLADLAARVREAFGENAAAVRSLPDFHSHRRVLSDSIIAIKIAPISEGTVLGTLTRLIRLLDLIDRIARGEAALEIAGAVPAVLAEALIIPSTLFPLPPSPRAVVPHLRPDEDAKARLREVADLQARETLLHDTMHRLVSVSAADIREPDLLQSSPSRPSPAPPKPPVARSSALGELLDRLLPRRAFESPVAATGGIDPGVRDPSPSLLLRPEAIARLSPAAQDLMSELGADLGATDVSEALNRVESELDRVGRQLARLQPQPTRRQLVRIGSSLVPATPSLPSLPAPSDDFADEGALGRVGGVSLGNLLLVRQEIIRYEVGEVAHLENVLRGESKERTTRRFHRNEETLTVERETTSVEELDQQTTKRFELLDEMTKTVQEDQAFNVGVSVSAAYGPFVQVDANTDFSSSSSTTDTARRASSYVEEMLSRAVKKVSDRIRTEQTTRAIEEYEETNRHGLNNVDSDEHVAGIYQWVNKVYEAQIYDYGLRMLCDFIAPEPAALFLRALRDPTGNDIVEPPAFTWRPDQITVQNFQELVTRYHVEGVEAPPSYKRVVSIAWAAKTDEWTGSMTQAQVIDLPSGYEAVEARIAVKFGQWLSAKDGGELPEKPVLSLLVGEKRWTFINGETAPTHKLKLSGERGSIPVSMAASFPAFHAVNVEVLCWLTVRCLVEWQLATHTAITKAYLKLQADYEEKIAAAAVQRGVQIEGRNPTENRLIERAEIKKQCISLLVGQTFDAFGSIIESDDVFPHINFAQAEQEGRNIRFFEHAFEWENMTYVFYPYYWGRKSLWLERLLQHDVDPEHAEFLKAGAARVVVPVRPGFEHAVVHFQETGQIWEGGELPQIGSPQYLDILEEVKGRLQAPGSEVPVGEPWEVLLPTTLVRLRPDSSLPRWERDADGHLQPVDNS